MSTRALRVVVMMVRPPVVLVLLLFAAVGVAQGGRGNDMHPLFTTVAFVVGAWFVHATVLNDLGDEPIDRVNLPHARGRPLVSGDASRAELGRLGWVAGSAALLVATMVHVTVGLVVLVGLALNAAYSLRPARLCDRGGVATAVLPCGYVAVPYLVGLLSVRPRLDGGDVVLLVALYVGFVGRIILKDFRDVAGDAVHGKRTYLLRHGRVRTCAVSAASWTLGTAILVAHLGWQPLLVPSLVVLLAAALHALTLLTRASHGTEELVVIGAIAQIGRAMVLALIAHLTMASLDWSGWRPVVVMAVIVVPGLAMARSTLARRRQPVMARPW